MSFVVRRIFANVAIAAKQFKRCKFTPFKGVKGIRNRKGFYVNQKEQEQQQELQQQYEQFDLQECAYDELASDAMHVSRDVRPHNVLIIQPYIKWGTNRNQLTTSDQQLLEAAALVQSLPSWQIVQTLTVPLESLERKTLFGSGKLLELKNLIKQLRQQEPPLSCIFISKGSLSFAQKCFLEMEFQLPVMDRYSLVIQILRLHANSAEARLQVAMAEIPYIWALAKDAGVSSSRKQGYNITDAQREVLRQRERKLKQELDSIRSQRKLLRSKRQQRNYPSVAVVGYTNAGKTSLIKALTQETALQPKNQLFATLDVTAHAGLLPCKLQVLYMDTVGFMSDLPTGLIECFVATLEDAMLADVIVHVQDVSHACHASQKLHVENTLKSLAETVAGMDANVAATLPAIINVGNKIDLLPTSLPITSLSEKEKLHLVSSKTHVGLHQLLLDIEQNILKITGRRKLRMRVPNGGNEMAWLYKNAAVVDLQADDKNSELLLMDVVITEQAMQQFKKEFC